MSLSASGSSTNNPFAYLQSLWQQASSPSGTSSQSDPLAALLSELDGQQGAGTASGANGTASSTADAATAAGTSSQFGPQTLQALLALQDNGSSLQSQFDQFANAVNGADPTSGQAQQSDGQQGHHHHWDTGSSSNNSSGQDPLAMLANATSQTTTNANGSTTISINYANGSSVSMTTAAPGGSDSTSSQAGAASVTGNNLIEQWIQMQAQLVNSAATQSIATA
jgi:hypothetical protein